MIIDSDNNNNISPSNLLNFMKKQYLDARVEDAEAVIREYDGNINKTIDYEQFCQFILPATNPNLRNIATNRRL